MQQIEFTNKEQVFYNKYMGNFATPKKLNRSTKNVPNAIIEDIESGNITSGAINTAALIVPVFTYKTCLTIHGNLPPVSVSRIGGYKNIIQNKNGSLEIRYSAIDYQQKREIRGYLKNTDWNAKENSQTGIYFEKTKRTPDKSEALNIYAEMQKEAEIFNIEGMKAKVYVSGFNYWGYYYLTFAVLPLIIEGNPLQIAAQLTGKTVEQIDQEKATEAAERQQREQQINAAQQAREAARLEAQKAVQAYRPEPLKPTQGKIYVCPTITVSNKPAFRFYRVANIGSFGRVILDSYLSDSLNLNPEKFSPYMKGKQVKPTEISGTTYLYN